MGQKLREWLRGPGRLQHLVQTATIVGALVLIANYWDSRRDVASQAQAATQNEIAQLQSAQAAAAAQIDELKRGRSVTDDKIDKLSDLVSRLDQSVKYLTDALSGRRH